MTVVEKGILISFAVTILIDCARKKDKLHLKLCLLGGADTDYRHKLPQTQGTKTGQLNTFSRLQALELIYCVKEGGVVCVKGLPNEFTTNGSECTTLSSCCRLFVLQPEDLGATGICIMKLYFADDV